MKKVILPLLISISFMLLAAFAVLYKSDATYVIGRNRLQDAHVSLLLPLRRLLEFTTPYEEKDPYALADDLVSSGLHTSRVLFVMGRATPSISESADLYKDLDVIYKDQATRSATPILDRYAIDYAVLDLPPTAKPAEKQRYDRWKSILQSSDRISIYRTWGTIIVYRIEREVAPEAYAILSNPLPNYPDATNVSADMSATSSALFYKTDKSAPYKRYFPFSDIHDGVFFTEKNIRLEDRNGYVYITRDLDLSKHAYSIENEATASAIKTEIRQGSVVASTKEVLVEHIDLGSIQVKNCGSKKGTLETNVSEGAVSVKVSMGAVACFSYRLSRIAPGAQYLVHLRSESIEGLPLKISISETGTDKTITSGSLNNTSEYIILSAESSPKGYTLSFRSESDLNFASASMLNEISIFNFPLHEAQHIALTQEKDALDTSLFMRTYSENTGLTGYQYQPDPVPYETSFIFWQPANLRWTAYTIPNSYPAWKKSLARALPFAFAQPLNHHYTVNGWAHGWDIPSGMDGHILIFSFIRFLTTATLIFAAILIVVSVIIVIA